MAGQNTLANAAMQQEVWAQTADHHHHLPACWTGEASSRCARMVRIRHAPTKALSDPAQTPLDLRLRHTIQPASSFGSADVLSSPYVWMA